MLHILLKYEKGHAHSIENTGNKATVCIPINGGPIAQPFESPKEWPDR